MSNEIRFKRRVTGAAGSPASLKSGEPAYNMVDDIIYAGKGDDGGGVATSIVPVGGSGAFVNLTSSQTVAGAKTFSTVPKASQDASGSTDLVRKSQLDTLLGTKAATSHAHAVSDVTGLQTALDGKAPTAHTHTIANVTNLQTTLDGKSATGHGHAIADVTGLQAAIDGKSATGHAHLIADVTGLQTELNGKSATAHTHAIANVTGLQTALDGKAASSHTHSIANVTGLQAAIDAKAPLASPALTGVPTAPTAVANTNTTQVATTAYVVTALAGFGAGDMLKVTYDSTNNGKVDLAEVAEAAPWSGITGKPSTFTPSAHTHAISETTGLQVALDAKAPLAGPALTGVATAPTQASTDNSTKIATTAYVKAVVAALIEAAPTALDTLNELAAAIGDDPNFATTVTNSISEKLVKASNLSDLTNAVTARSNLGLGSIATQNANAVAITGGSIDNIVIDGGTF